MTQLEFSDQRACYTPSTDNEDEEDMQSVDMSMPQQHAHCVFKTKQENNNNNKQTDRQTNKQTNKTNKEEEKEGKTEKEKSLVQSLSKFNSLRTGRSSGVS